MATAPRAAKTTLLATVRSGFIAKGTSLASWCEANGISREWATQCLDGKAHGPAASEIISRLRIASEPEQNPEHITADHLTEIWEIGSGNSWLWGRAQTQCMGAFRAAHALGNQAAADHYWSAYEQASARLEMCQQQDDLIAA